MFLRVGSRLLISSCRTASSPKGERIARHRAYRARYQTERNVAWFRKRQERTKTDGERPVTGGKTPGSGGSVPTPKVAPKKGRDDKSTARSQRFYATLRITCGQKKDWQESQPRSGSGPYRSSSGEGTGARRRNARHKRAAGNTPGDAKPRRRRGENRTAEPMSDRLLRRLWSFGEKVEPGFWLDLDHRDILLSKVTGSHEVTMQRWVNISNLCKLLSDPKQFSEVYPGIVHRAVTRAPRSFMGKVARIVKRLSKEADYMDNFLRRGAADRAGARERDRTSRRGGKGGRK